MSLKTPKTKLLGTGFAVPEKILTNHDLEKIVDTNDKWITERTGIKQRYIADDKLTTSELCTRAARKALDDAGISALDLDAILIATVSGDAAFPATACYVQEKLGAHNAAAMDLQAACSGFVYTTALADAMITSGQAKHVLVIGGELLSRLVDWTDRTTCVLFGDGAGAAIYGPADDESGILDSYLKSDGRLTELLCMTGGGTKVPLHIAVEQKLHYIKMQGQEVFKYAVKAMGDAADHILQRNNLSGEDIDLLIPHQANIRIIRATSKRANIGEDKVYINVDRFGNTSAASIPIALSEALQNGVLKKGNLVLLVAFGGGFTWGSSLIRL